jgi:small-conductance mechanosensitive channel
MLTNFGLIQRNLAEIGITTDIQGKLIKTVVVFLLLFFIRKIVARITASKINQKEELYKWGKIGTYSFYIMSFILIGNIWFQGVQSLATFFGLLTAGLAVAFKDYLSNTAGWLYILWWEPFKVGHRISIGDTIGDIIDIGPVHLSLLEINNTANAEQHSGKIIFLPNSKLFTDSIANYDMSFPYIWHEIHVVVTYESDWKKAKEIIKNVVNESSLVYDEHSLRRFRQDSKKFLLPEATLNPEVYTSAVDHGVMLAARFVCEPRNRRTLEKKVWEDLLQRFAQEDGIDFAYPTQRFYDNKLEGKPLTGGPRKES